MEEIFQDFLDEPPDVVVFNSCLWDITRYGPFSVSDFETRVEKLFKYLEMVLLPSCLFFWVASLPVLTNAHNSFLLPRVHYKGHRLRLDLLEANYFVHELCYKYERDFLDLNFHFRDLTLLHQLGDGIHWNGFANRKFSNYIVRYIADSLGMTLNPMEPLLEYASSAVIEIDTNFSTSLNIPTDGSFQSNCNYLSPENSSDWGKCKFSSSTKSRHHSASFMGHENCVDFSFGGGSSSDSHVKKPDYPKLDREINVPEEFQSCRIENEIMTSSSCNTKKGIVISNQECRRQRTQISYSDLFEDTFPSIDGKQFGNKQKRKRKKIHKAGSFFCNQGGCNKGKTSGEIKEASGKLSSKSVSDGSSSDGNSAQPSLEAATSKDRIRKSISTEEIEDSGSSNACTKCKNSRNPFFTKFI